MSVLRFSSPGLSTEFRDLGPSVGRTSHTRKQGGSQSLIAGQLAVGDSGNPGKSEVQRVRREKQRRQRTRQDVIDRQLSGKVTRDRPKRDVVEDGPPACDLWMPVAMDWCGRYPGHAGKCRTRTVLSRQAQARRARRAA